MRSLGILCIGIIAISCNKPPIEDCQKACWNASTVKFWSNVDKEVASLPAEEARKIRAIREVEFRKFETLEEDQGFMNCVSKCRTKGTKEAVTCTMNATTEAKLKVCLDM